MSVWQRRSVFGSAASGFRLTQGMQRWSQEKISPRHDVLCSQSLQKQIAGQSKYGLIHLDDYILEIGSTDIDGRHEAQAVYPGKPFAVLSEQLPFRATMLEKLSRLMRPIAACASDMRPLLVFTT